jgi:phosphomannomutase
MQGRILLADTTRSVAAAIRREAASLGLDVDAVAPADAEASLGGEGRILVRASGTEPLVRVMVEAATPELARRTADDLADVARRRFGSS